MSEQIEALEGQEAPTESSSDIAASLFSDISNPAVEAAAAEETATSSENEPVIPSIADFQQQEDTAPVVVNEPVAPAIALPVVVEPVAAPVALQTVAPAFVPEAIAPVATPAKELSSEELDVAINRYKVTPEIFNQLFTEEDPNKASAIFDGILQGAVKQAVTMSVHLIQDQAARLQQSVAPYMQFADTQREFMLRDQFFQKHPDLVGQDLVIGTVMQQLATQRQSGKYNPASEQQVFEDVATSTKALIAQMQQHGQHVAPRQGGVVPQGAPQGKPTMVSLPMASGGAGAGSANGSPSAASGESQAARSVFG